MFRKICPALGILLLALVTGCEQETYYYSPNPAIAQIPPTPPQQSPPLTAMATVVGVVDANQKQGIPESVDVRLRLEDTGTDPISFDPRSMDLIDGSLMEFLPPRVQQTPVTLQPTEAASVDALFPFPPGYSASNTNMSSMELRWQVQIGKGAPIVQVVDFHRIYPTYYEQPYPYPYYYPYGFYGGVVIVHRR
ncbi:MAG TPA: hypothetical protein VMD30_05705 [Tepidisphaeraceae bacterium]|nr:hypothetical protein [Tepidisphaeraceae bacterium]